MTTGKDLKRRIRARMSKTGESYTAARAQILRRQLPSLPHDYEQLAGMSDDALAAKTGRTWPQWVETLDEIGATEMEHRAIARWIHDETGLDWWAQTVTVGYERIRGLRDVGQRRDGAYEVGRSRTFPVPVTELFDVFVDDARRRQWLDTAATIRKATPHRTVRFSWHDGSNVDVYLTDKGPSRSTVTVQHGKLPSRKASEEAKAYWAGRLDALAALLK